MTALNTGNRTAALKAISDDRGLDVLVIGGGVTGAGIALDAATRGLLQMTRTDRRAGRPISYYRSSQDAYRVPLAATGFTDHRDQARRIGAPIYRRITDAYSAALFRSGAATRFITRDDNGGIYSTDLPPHHTDKQHPLLFEDRIVQLTAHQAEWLCGHLDRTLQELTERDDTNETDRQNYAVMVAAVPLPD